MVYYIESNVKGMGLRILPVSVGSGCWLLVGYVME
jgi:hypothetical protein